MDHRFMDHKKTFKKTMKKQINLSELLDVKCPCGSLLFTKVVTLKRVPGLLIAQPNDDVVPVEVFQCNKCKIVLNIPEALKKCTETTQNTNKNFMNFLRG